MQQAVTCHRIITDTQVLREHSVLVKDGLIEAVVPTSQVPHNYPIVSLPGRYLTPGLVDIHVHGAAGYSYNNADTQGVRAIACALRKAGVTTALPTFTSDHPSSLLAASRDILGVRQEIIRTPAVHWEGPCFSPHQAGAQDPRRLYTPQQLLQDGTIEEIEEAADGIAMISLAPELPGALELTGRLVGAGIVVAAGHTDGTDADLAACVQAGLSHITHIYSSQSTTRRRGPWRVPGMLEATLASRDLSVEMIADGRHLPAPLMEIAHRCLGSQLLVVSDATAGAGLSRGERYIMGEMTYEVGDGVGLTLDGASFGGSTTLLGHMLPVLISELGLTLPEALAMMTSRPAQAARLERVGQLAPGYYADFTLFDEHLTPLATALGGVWNL